MAIKIRQSELKQLLNEAEKFQSKKGDNDFAIAPELLSTIFDLLIPQEKIFLPLRTVSKQFKEVVDSKLLNTQEILDDLQSPILNERDRTHLFQQQKVEINHFKKNSQRLFNHYAHQKGFSKLQAALYDLDLITEDTSPLSLYKRHKALNNINTRIIEIEIECQRAPLEDDFSFNKTLHLGKKALTRFPNKLFENEKYRAIWENIETLILASNKIQHLPVGMKKLKNMRVLYVENNQLTKLPALAKTVSNVDLRYNSFTVLPVQLKDSVYQFRKEPGRIMLHKSDMIASQIKSPAISQINTRASL